MITKQQVRQELLERYENTGRVGLNKIRSRKKALSLIDTISQLYEDDPETLLNEDYEDPNEDDQEEIVFSLTDISNKLIKFLN